VHLPLALLEGPTTAGKRHCEWQVERSPAIVLEALLRIVPKEGDEIVLGELVELVLRLRDEAGVPIKWVTAESFRWMGPLLPLRQRGCQTDEISPDDPQPYNALKSAIYDGLLETYHYPIFSHLFLQKEQLFHHL